MVGSSSNYMCSWLLYFKRLSPPSIMSQKLSVELALESIKWDDINSLLKQHAHGWLFLSTWPTINCKRLALKKKIQFKTFINQLYLVHLVTLIPFQVKSPALVGSLKITLLHSLVLTENCITLNKTPLNCIQGNFHQMLLFRLNLHFLQINIRTLLYSFSVSYFTNRVNHKCKNVKNRAFPITRSSSCRVKWP